MTYLDCVVSCPHKLILIEPGTNNGTEIEQANIQESINMEALDKVLAMAVNARKIQAQVCSISDAINLHCL